MKFNPDLNLTGGVSFFDKLLFTKHLGIMLKTGIPLADAIETISDQTKSSSFKKILEDITKSVSNGQTLSKSLDEHPKVFDKVYVNLIKIGEDSGNLESNLAYLAVQLQKDYLFKQKVIGASMYPILILVTSVAYIIAQLVYVFPKLITLFSSMDIELPLTTRVLLAISEITQTYGLHILAGIIIFLILFRLILQIKPVRYVWHSLLLGLPVMGPLLQNIQMTSFSRNIGIMLKSGIPISNGLLTIEETTTNLVFKKYVNNIRNAVESGQEMEDEIKNHDYRYMPKIALKMIGVGEKTGSLDETFLYLADFFEGEVDNTSKNFSGILEPVMLLVMGLIVGFLALSIISPIYQFTSSINK